MKSLLLLFLLTSCSFLSKKEKNQEEYRINQCLFYNNSRVMIIDKTLTDYVLFYNFQKEMYVSSELKYFVHSRMIPITCTQEFINSMNKFIEKAYIE